MAVYAIISHVNDIYDYVQKNTTGHVPYGEVVGWLHDNVERYGAWIPAQVQEFFVVVNNSGAGSENPADIFFDALGARFGVRFGVPGGNVVLAPQIAPGYAGLTLRD